MWTPSRTVHFFYFQLEKMFYKTLRNGQITDIFIYLVKDDFKDAEFAYLNYTPNYVYRQICKVVDTEVPETPAEPKLYNYAQVKFSYPQFNQRVETLTDVVSVENSLYLSTIQALRKFTAQIFREFMTEMDVMSASDYYVYTTTEYRNAFERAFCDGEIHIRLKDTSILKSLSPLILRQHFDERICVKRTDAGLRPLHEADEKAQKERDQQIRDTRLRCCIENQQEFINFAHREEAGSYLEESAVF